MNKTVRSYIDTVLAPQLVQFGVSVDYQKVICSTVSRQMYSALYNWQGMRKVFITLTAEEAHFYEPDAPEDIKCFVVLAVRNSPIESLQSDNYINTGLQKMLTEPQVKDITSKAILYYRDIDLLDCFEDIEIFEQEYFAEDDICWNLSQKYFVAWRTLEQISNSPVQSCDFDSYARKDIDTILTPLNTENTIQTKNVQTAVDGYDINIDGILYSRLKDIAENKQIFFADCFKMVSRNPEKLLCVIEYLLSQDAIFLTSNYLLAHTHAEKRKEVLRAASSKNVISDIRSHLKNKNGLEELHSQLLSRVDIG